MKIRRAAALALACAFMMYRPSPGMATEAGAEADTPLYIVISRPDQHLTVYRGTDAVATSRVSTGKPGHITPTGVYSIIQKARFHRSNKYDDAPMPFMERITWSGIALHGSNSVPGHPASHGCVRLPPAFAKDLYGMTAVGAHVIIANTDVAPKEVDAPVLFQPATLSASAAGWSPAEVAALRPTIGAKAPSAPRGPVATSPVRILITRITPAQMIRDTQRLLNEVGYDVGDVDGYVGPDTRAGIKGFQALVGMKRTGTVSKELLAELYRIAGKGEPAMGHLYVRRNFKPVYDAPVTIRDPAKPLGTHFLLADFVGTDHPTARWLDVSLESRIPNTVRKQADMDLPDDATVATDIADVLGRITVPPEARQHIAQMLVSGSSLVIADRGPSLETGKGTDFVVQTGF